MAQLAENTEHPAGTPERPYRLAILSSHPIQYAVPLYRRLAKQRQIDLHVYYCSLHGAERYWDPGFERFVEWDIPLLEGYQWTLLRNYSVSRIIGKPMGLINPGIIREIVRNRFDAIVISGYIYPTNWMAMLAAKMARTAVFYRSESSLRYDRNYPRPRLTMLAKRMVVRFLCRRVVDRFLSIGTYNREFYLHYGAKERQIDNVPYTVDNDFFGERAACFRGQRAGIRRELGIDEDAVVFLFASKMIEAKRPMAVLEAYERMKVGGATALIMVGDGPLLSGAQEYVRARGLGNVVFTGFANQAEIPKYYGVSDVFVRAEDSISRGDWGLTVNEAGASGLALIVTEKIGAAADLVRNGENGLVLRGGDPEALSMAMAELAGNAARCSEMGRRSVEIMRGWSYEQCVEGILAALASIGDGDIKAGG